MPAHRIRKRHVEQPVVRGQQRDEKPTQLAPRGGRDVGQARDRHQRQDQRLERPHRPVRNDRHPARALVDDALAACVLEARVVGEQPGPVRGGVGALVLVLGGGLVGQRVRRPDLPVRVRVRAAHQLALVLERLHPPVAGAQRRRLRRVRVDHRRDVGGRHLGQRQIVARREADHAARAPHALRPEQRPAVGVVDRAVGVLQRREVVVEHERAAVARVGDAARALVARAEVAAGIVRRPLAARRRLVTPLPRPLRALGRHQHPLAGQRVEAAVRPRAGAHGRRPRPLTRGTR